MDAVGVRVDSSLPDSAVELSRTAVAVGVEPSPGVARAIAVDTSVTSTAPDGGR